MKGETFKGHLDMLILASVSQQARHGYGIIESIKQRSGQLFNLPEGTVYPVLHRLERAGFLRSRWIEAEGRKRREYLLTPRGRARLTEAADEWVSFAGAVRNILAGAHS